MLSTFSIPLGRTAHDLAESRCQPHTDWQKSEQVYLNTLAIYAVDYYVKCLGFDTDWKASDSQDFITQTLMNVADLTVKSIGRLECRFVSPDTSFVYVPEEVWADRVGYIAIQINRDLDEAEILGFVEQVNTIETPFNQLRSIDELPTYLSQLRAKATIININAPASFTPPVQLSQWLQGQFDQVWQTIESVFAAPPLTPAWRQHHSPNNVEPIRRVKLLDFGAQPGAEQLALFVEITPSASDEIEIEVQLRPTGNLTHLPREIQARLLNETDEEIWQNRAALSEAIQLQFLGQLGEQFKIELTVSNRQIIETFVI
ncbi:DUF1822 family protein [Leptolyngbya sp. FACHB-711]|uniref:DUF1822 family protein n=1 Tax=Leptolyngbya sp. FACHB-711 TaxID=2692813 RepID=UPI001682DA76|nr:DUF1822 family protein [Leptolyngbya sp. FACHB-711]MBD2028202.1 DUF1822 family protein [Leptolyngbya sp. FACHB-711]